MAAPLYNDRGKHFGELVYRCIRNHERFEVKTVAEGVGMSYQAFYQRLQGSTPFTADEIHKLISFFPDPEIVDYLLTGTAYVAAERLKLEAVDNDEEEDDEIVLAAHRIIFEATNVLEVIDQALDDKRIDHREAETILKNIVEAERSLVSLRNFVASIN